MASVIKTCGHLHKTYSYYSFKTFFLYLIGSNLPFILHNQLALTKFGRNLCNPANEKRNDNQETLGQGLR